MKADDLLKRIIAYGADESGIKDRFMDDAELYKTCFDEFIVEANFDALREAMNDKDYPKAFEAAHALKGLSGNLGLTAFYDAIRALVESLRAENYEAAQTEYEEAEIQQKRLIALSSEDSKTEASGTDFTHAAKEETPKTSARKPAKGKKKRDRLMIAVLLTMLAALLLIGYVFQRVIGSHQYNTARESANHLIELNHQVKLYIEGKIASDWRCAYSLADTIEDGDFISNDESIFKLIRRKKAIWNVTDISIYTGNGYSVSAEGNVAYNVFASDVIANVKMGGVYSTVSESNIIYAVPVNTPILYKGSNIVAVSVAQSMEDFLDGMGFESFHGAATMYLTQNNGVVISKLSDSASKKDTDTVYNIAVMINGSRIEGLTGQNVGKDALLSGDEAGAYTLTDSSESNYLVSTPIETRFTPMRLFYVVPTDVVNINANSFSIQLITVSMVMIVIFALGAVFVFSFLYKTRKRRFNEELVARDGMIDQLIKHTSTVFGLFNINTRAPKFISSNSLELLDDEGWSLSRDDTGFYWRDSHGETGGAIDRVNEAMHGWDGRGEFKSGYIVNDAVTPAKYFEICLYPVGDGKEDYVAMALDVTDAHKREESVKAALTQAKEANAAKSAFLSNMSHDIRTPMNAIVNMAVFAKENIDNPKGQAEYLDTIIESSQHLLNLINDILDMSRIDSGIINIASEPFDLKKAVLTQTDIIRALCETKRQTFIADLDGITTKYVLGDELKFSQIIANLLSNAYKFTPEKGGVRIMATELPANDDNATTVRISVEDTGCGISQEFLPHVFDVFSRADKKRVSKIEGSGLGLSICKSYVDAMGGTITCQSEEGEGTIFTVEMRLLKADDMEIKDDFQSIRGNATFIGMHCLVAEDIATNQVIAKLILERLGFVVDIANDGREAVEKFVESTPGRYDVIYMDIQMPVMDGYEATTAIRNSAHPQARTIPIISMTANVFTEDAQKAQSTGMNGHIGKPVRTNELVRVTKKAMFDGANE